MEDKIHKGYFIHYDSVKDEYHVLGYDRKFIAATETEDEAYHYIDSLM